ncbi:hypothetical protein [Vibrio phage vB_VibM_83AMN]|nr:hypothetical protein [Vibrio phage vB_VibM_83AMN]
MNSQNRYNFTSLKIEDYEVCRTDDNNYGVKQDDAGFIYVDKSLLKCVLFACRITDVLPGTILRLFVTHITVTKTESIFVTVGKKYKITPQYSDVGFTLINDNGNKHSFGWISRSIEYKISGVKFKLLNDFVNEQSDFNNTQPIETNYHVRRLNWFIRLLNWIKGK